MISKGLGIRLGYMAPIFLMAIFAVHGRTAVAPAQLVVDNPEAEETLEAYRFPTQQLYRIGVKQDFATISKEELLRTSNLWIENWKSGRLVPVLPADISDTCHNGVKFEINEMKVRFANLLVISAREEAARKNYDAAADMFRRALLVAYVMKYSDFASVTGSQTPERNALIGLMSIANRVTEPVRKELLSDLNEWRNLDRPLARMIMRRKDALTRYCDMAGTTHCAGSGLGAFGSIARLMDHESATKEGLKVLRAAVSKSSGEVLSSLSHIKIAWQHESIVNKLGDLAIYSLYSGVAQSIENCTGTLASR